jgi:hypothetical protein
MEHTILPWLVSRIAFKGIKIKLDSKITIQQIKKGEGEGSS